MPNMRLLVAHRTSSYRRLPVPWVMPKCTTNVTMGFSVSARYETSAQMSSCQLRWHDSFSCNLQCHWRPLLCRFIEVLKTMRLWENSTDSPHKGPLKRKVFYVITSPFPFIHPAIIPAITLQEVAIPAISKDDCERLWSAEAYKFNDSHICFYDGRGSGCMVGYQAILAVNSSWSWCDVSQITKFMGPNWGPPGRCRRWPHEPCYQGTRRYYNVYSPTVRRLWLIPSFLALQWSRGVRLWISLGM